ISASTWCPAPAMKLRFVSGMIKTPEDCSAGASSMRRARSWRRAKEKRMVSRYSRAALAAVGGVVWLAMSAGAAHAQAEARLAHNGAALQEVVVAAGATERTRAAAQTLAQYLGRISGAAFKVNTG